MLETTSAEMEILQSTNQKLKEQIKALQRKLDLQEASLKFIEKDSGTTNPDHEQSSDSGFADRHYNQLNNNTKPNLEVEGVQKGNAVFGSHNGSQNSIDFMNIGHQELMCKENFHLTTEDINIIYEETLPAPDNVEFFTPK